MQIIKHQHIKTETSKKKNDIPQCVCCQLWDHTKKHCVRNVRYVKCTMSILQNTVISQSRLSLHILISIVIRPIIKDALDARSIQKVTATKCVQQKKVLSVRPFTSVVCASARNIAISTQYIQQPTQKK